MSDPTEDMENTWETEKVQSSKITSRQFMQLERFFPENQYLTWWDESGGKAMTDDVVFNYISHFGYVQKIHPIGYVNLTGLPGNLGLLDGFWIIANTSDQRMIKIRAGSNGREFRKLLATIPEWGPLFQIFL